MEKQTRSILAILSTDIPGYTQKTEEDESYAFSLIAKHRDIINKHVGASNGFTFKEMGDGTFNKFDSAIDASRCAIKIQNEAVERELPLRVGVHLGDVVQEGDDVLGIGVNIADRIQGIAKPGTIYISEDIFRQIKNQPDLNTISRGEHALKGIQGKMTLHELVFNRDGTITERIEVTHKIQVHDEDGNKVEKETPKNEFLKTLTMFFFDNKTENSELDWLQYGIANACYYTLQQEKVIVMNKPYSMSEDFTGYLQKSDNIDSFNIPNTLKKKITNQQNKDYWISGNILNHQDGYCITTELYDAKLGKLLQKREFSGESIFSLIDNIALQLRYDLEIPTSHIESTDNLSISDIYTNNIKAFELYIRCKFEKAKGTKSKKELIKLQINSFEEVLKHDNEFPEAYWNLVQIHLILGNDDKLKECLEKLMTFLYKLPETEQYKIKGEYFRFIEKNPEKLIKLYELWAKLQPHNITAHKELAEAYYEGRFLDKALEHMLIVLNMNPTDFKVVSAIVDAYKEKNNFESAEKLLKNYIDSFPENYKPYSKLGGLYEKMGEFQKAKEQYEIVSLIEPNYNDLTLAKIETKFGEFDLAVNKLINLHDNPKKTKTQKYYILRALVDIYHMTGKLKKSIESSEKVYELEIPWPITAMNDAVALARIYIQLGDDISADKVLDKVKEILPTEDKSFMGSFLNVFKGELYLERNDYEKVEEIILEIDTLIQDMGFNMLKAKKERILAELHEKKGDWGNALEHYYASIDAPPDWGWEPDTIITGIGRCHRKLKEYNKSVESLLDMLHLDPYNPKIHYELALSYNEMKNSDKALEHLQIANDIWKDADKEYNIAQSAKKKLEKWST